MTDTPKHGFLESLEIASPCTASWADMTGDDRVRACLQCNKNVYDVSEMTREEAEALVRSREGRVCLRMFVREDGTILTDDCPVGLRMLKRTYKKASAFMNRKVASLVACGTTLVSTMLATAGVMAQSPNEKPVLQDDKTESKRAFDQKNGCKLTMGDVSSPKLVCTYPNAVRNSECVVTARYDGYDPGLISFYHPPLARFTVLETLKGPDLGKRIVVRHSFLIPNGEAKPTDWKFTADKMPAKGSKWILFISSQHPADGALDTFGGSYGRQVNDEGNRAQIDQILHGTIGNPNRQH